MRLSTYLDITSLGAHGVELEDANFAWVKTELGDQRLGLGAVGAVRLGEDCNEVLRNELVGNLLGSHLSFV